MSSRKVRSLPVLGNEPMLLRLKPIDVEVMRQLHTKVNLIPIIAKADTLTDEEVAEFKARVRICVVCLLINIPTVSVDSRRHSLP